MGIPILNNISKRFDVQYIFNRTRKEVPGHTITGSIEDLGSQCDLVFLMLSDTDACRSVIFDEKGLAGSMKRGSSIIDLSTILPSASEEIAEQLSGSGITYSDSPVIGSVKPATEGTLASVFGGRKDEFERLKPLIATYSSHIFYMGKSGYGSRMKIVNNLVMGANMAALAEGVSLSAALDLDLDLVLEALSSGGANSMVLGAKKEKISQADYSPQFALKHQLKDINYAVETARSKGLDLETTELVTQLYRLAGDAGLTEDDFSVILKFIREHSRR